MPASRTPSSLFRTAHACIDRLEVRLPAHAHRELGPCLAAISGDVDELLMLRDGVGGSAGLPNGATQARIDRLSAHCAVLEGALESDTMTAAAERAVVALVEACADIATWVMEAPAAAPAQVA